MVAIGHTSPEEAFVWRGGPCRGWHAGWRDPEIYVASARETLQSSQALRGLLGDCVAELRRSRRHGGHEEALYQRLRKARPNELRLDARRHTV